MNKESIQQLISPIGGAIASNKIMVDGLLVGYMYREEPTFDHDSGWRFFSGTETQEYADDASNFRIYEVNTVANFDEAIIPYLDFPVGTELERHDNSNKFIEVSG